MIAYTVRCTFDDPAVAREWLEWLRQEHLAEVCAAGAMDAEVIELRPQPGADDPGTASSPIYEVRYHFPSAEAFTVYEREHAPRLRTEGLKRFPPRRGLRYERSAGTVACYFAAGRAAT